MSKLNELRKAHKMAHKGNFSLMDKIYHQDFRGYDPRVSSWINYEEHKILLPTIQKVIKGGKSRIIFENEEFLCFEVFRKHLEVENDFIVTIAGVKYKNNEIIEMESLNENLDFDPSEGQDWNWEDYE